VSERQIPKGYKHTEIGVIPEDWDCLCINDVARVKGGKRLPPGFSLVDELTLYPYIRVSDMYPGGINTTNIKFVPLEAYPAIKNYRIFTKDIFISVAGTLGIVGVIPQELDGANLTENADIITDIQCDRNYLLYWLMSESIQQTIESIHTVGAQPKLALGRIAQFRIAVPRKRTEQRAIVEALADVDGLLAALDKLIAKKRAIKKAAMQQLLTGKTRLPGFSGEWEVRSLGDIANLKHGYAFRSETYTDDGPYIVVTIRNVQDGKLDLGEYNTISELPPDIQSHQILNIGDMLISLTGNVGRVCRVTQHNCLLNQRVGLIVPNYVSCDFIYFLLGRLDFLTEMIMKAKGGAQGNLGKRDVLEHKFCLPKDDREQRAIATVLSDMDAEIEALERRREKTQQVKQGMMQQLLIGRVRLVNPEYRQDKRSPNEYV